MVVVSWTGHGTDEEKPCETTYSNEFGDKRENRGETLLTNHKIYAILHLPPETHKEPLLHPQNRPGVTGGNRAVDMGVDQPVADDDLRVSLPDAKSDLNN